MTFAEFDSAVQLSVALCLLSLFSLLWLLRRNGPSFGLPFAYLSLLLVNHVPGAVVPLLDREFNVNLLEVATGIRLTAIGALCFVIGVWYARHLTQAQRLAPQPASHLSSFREDRYFWFICVLGGWLFTFGLTPLRSLPSVGAIVHNGGAIWMLGVLLGLRWAAREKRTGWTMIWLACLAVYPVLTLLLWGFLGYGAAAVLIVVCVLAVTGRRYERVFAAISAIVYLGLSLFTNYFQVRDGLRAVMWSNASMERRIEAAGTILTNWKFFDSNDQLVLIGLDLRLNQNFFVGLAAQNLENGRVDYLYGRSVSEAVLALIPRAVWPNKTVFAGSPAIVSDMTGLTLSTSTSWGVGNVMEFYINFGVYGLVGGFFILGWAIGRLDHRASLAEAKGDYATTALFFLPAVGLIQPLGSMVELVGSAASAWLAAHFWNWAWSRWYERKMASSAVAGVMGH